MNKNLLPFGFFGIISGILSIFSFAQGFGAGIFAKIIGYGPGWIFGITLSILLYFFYRKKVLLHILFVLVSIGAFYASVMTFSSFGNDDDSTKALMVAGLVGSAILVAFLRLMYPIAPKCMLIIVVVGTFAGGIAPGLFRIFTLWQPAVAIAIYYAVEKSKVS